MGSIFSKPGDVLWAPPQQTWRRSPSWSLFPGRSLDRLCPPQTNLETFSFLFPFPRTVLGWALKKSGDVLWTEDVPQKDLEMFSFLFPPILKPDQGCSLDRLCNLKTSVPSRGRSLDGPKTPGDVLWAKDVPWISGVLKNTWQCSAFHRGCSLALGGLVVII